MNSKDDLSHPAFGDVMQNDYILPIDREAQDVTKKERILSVAKDSRKYRNNTEK
jgi:hypothetical protein